ncbi:hypothetical protein FC694_19195 [Bacillus wiedmannii]|uniref:Peptidase M4 C-terminal domain-containing protein n=1 Tax=Bacillus wiedmannii TaxID=1890302 RepID=A0A4U2MQP7_9BACI|nr:hypothetical protein [Bacillus wiedmannii]TKH13715.1 hypothetical protein FC694_19195 [Bacillus wiedmannii]
MSQSLDTRAYNQGTRFLIFPQNRSLKGFENPETVYIDSPPGTIEAGPTDNRMYVVDAPNKEPYGTGYAPPYKRTDEDPVPVPPDANGHFDYISPDDPAFSSVMLFASVRRVLDIWEDYFGKEIPWAFRNSYSKLEMIPRVDKILANAFSGWGYIEFGVDPSVQSSNSKRYFSDNFDVIAHELGHQIKYSIIGIPNHKNEEFDAHHESFGDLVAIISTLHFDSVINRLLETTKGNLFSINELSRLAELSDSKEIRIVFNYEKFTTVSRQPHSLSLPFTGGAFDAMVEIFQTLLIERNIIPRSLGESSYHASEREVPDVQKEFDHYYSEKPLDFKQALLDARDIFGKLMARAWSKTEVDNFAFWKVVNNMIDADKELNKGKYTQTIRDCFEWRELSQIVNPYFLKPREIIHGFRESEKSN